MADSWSLELGYCHLSGTAFHIMGDTSTALTVGSQDIDLHLKAALLDSIAEQLVNDYTSRLKLECCLTMYNSLLQEAQHRSLEVVEQAVR